MEYKIFKDSLLSSTVFTTYFKQCVRDMCDHISSSVGPLLKGRIAERVTELCASMHPGGAANPDLISGIVNFVFALNCTVVNLKPLNGMSIQLAEVTHSRYESS